MTVTITNSNDTTKTIEYVSFGSIDYTETAESNLLDLIADLESNGHDVTVMVEDAPVVIEAEEIDVYANDYDEVEDTTTYLNTIQWATYSNTGALRTSKSHYTEDGKVTLCGTKIDTENTNTEGAAVRRVTCKNCTKIEKAIIGGTTIED